MSLDDITEAAGAGGPIVKDLDHARAILKDTIGVRWGDKIKHSEPQVIVACAIVCHEFAESLEKLNGQIGSLETWMDEIEGRTSTRG